MSTTSPAPTAKQLGYLRALAHRTGQTFTPPRTRAQASQEIRRLKQTTTRGFTFAELQAKQAARHNNDDLPLPASSYRPGEITGYGGNCTWSERS